MTKLAYLECPTGIAGDMCLGALVDAGVELEYLKEQLKKLGIEQEYELRAESVHRNNQLATKVEVDLLRSDALAHHQGYHHHHNHSAYRHLPEISRMISAADLPSRAKDWSLKVFQRLAEAEGAVHGVPANQVHFHEVGATDAIVDIVGTCLGLDWLGIDQLYCSALPTGGGTVQAAHGKLPVPVPAVLKLWESRRVPVYSNGIERELVTPTGAALAVTLATDFGFPPAMTLARVGLGAGTQNLPIPNILRLWIGQGRDTPTTPVETSELVEGSTLETISVLETQIDDANPQVIGYVFEALFAAGAVDVFTQACGMKKSRLGVLLTVICHPEHLSACEAVIFRETTTLGVRRLTQQRTILQREIQEVQIKYGLVRVKVAYRGYGEKARVSAQPEYSDCAELARKNQLAFSEIHQMALHNWYLQNNHLTIANDAISN